MGAVQRVWADEAAFRLTVAEFGAVERCFVMHNPDGKSKVCSASYALTSYTALSILPDALACLYTWCCKGTHNRIQEVCQYLALGSKSICL